jgi:hypothetical protein
VLFKNITARQRGLVVLGGAAACGLVNVFDLRTSGMYFTLLFPFAFAMAPVGIVLLLFGSSAEDIRSGSLPKSAARLMLALMVAGAVLGFAVNHAVAR